MFRKFKPNRAIRLALVIALSHLPARAEELPLVDYDNQSVFNHFSGDSGAFANGEATVTGSFDTDVFHGSFGSSLRLKYSVTSGFCGVWNSLLGKGAYPGFALNLTNLHGSLRNSAGNPSRVEGLRAESISFWARGDGVGTFNHYLKLELKGHRGVVGNAIFAITNDTQWRRYEFPLATILERSDVSAVKELVYVLEDWRNDFRSSGTLYIDDVSLMSDATPMDPARWSDEAVLDIVSHRAFSYFLRFTDKLGFALDRSTFSDMVSTGTIGFQLAAFCIGHRHGWADRSELENRVLTILRNLDALPMGPEPGMSRAGYRGFYYHFLTADTGLRKDTNVELSIYDTMLLMYGVLTCKQYFSDNPEIQRLSQQLFDRVEWNWFVDRRPGPNQYQFFLDWIPERPEAVRFQNHIDGQTDEAFMVDVLALGSRTFPVLRETYLARRRHFGSYPHENGPRILVSWRGSMFNYFFASCWLNFETRGIDLHAREPVDIWRNNKLAILANRQFCIDHSTDKTGLANGFYGTYGENAWGITACDTIAAPTLNAPSDYQGFGALPTEENQRFRTKALHSGTIAVYGAASAINFTPEESLAAIRHFFRVPRLWSSLFGFGDAFSLDPHYFEAPYDADGNPTIRAATHLNGPWVNTMTMGINLGPMLLAIENYRSGLIWNLSENSPEIAAGLDHIFGIQTASVEGVWLETQDHERTRLRWKSLPEASEYAVYASANFSDWQLLQGGIRTNEWTAPALPPGNQQFYLVKAIR